MPKQILNSIISETTKIILGRKRKLVANFDVGPASKQTNKQANLEEEKYQMKSHPALNIELKKKKKKLVKLKKEVEKQKMSETTNWLRLRSHSYLVQKLPKNGPKTPFSPILSAICAVLFIHLENSYRYRLNKLEIFRIFLLYAVATHLQ